MNVAYCTDISPLKYQMKKKTFLRRKLLKIIATPFRPIDHHQIKGAVTRLCACAS